jgi:hypothetical protein
LDGSEIHLFPVSSQICKKSDPGMARIFGPNPVKRFIHDALRRKGVDPLRFEF